MGERRRLRKVVGVTLSAAVAEPEEEPSAGPERQPPSIVVRAGRLTATTCRAVSLSGDEVPRPVLDDPNRISPPV